MTKLHISPDLALPLDAATGTFGILATKGAGKSNAAVVMAEQMYDAGIPWVAIDPKGDWHGVRSSSDGKGPGLPIPVFGGRHSDVPLEPTAGAMLAELILTKGLTCVLDVSQFTKADVTRFLLAFGRYLFTHADDDGAEPIHLFLEEAHEYLPQKVTGDQATNVDVWQRIVKQGRFKGLGCTLISQRSSVLNKDVLELIDTLIVLRTIGPRSRDSIKEWVKDQDVDAGLLASLPSLGDGEAWVWSPGALRILQRIRFSRRRTFDSGATPKVGEKRRVPSTIADVDLAAIKEAMAETIERAKADDPRELRKRIAELERHRCPEPTAVEPERIEVPVLDAETRHLVEDTMRQIGGSLTDAVETLRAALTKVDTGNGRQDVPRARPASDRPRPVERPGSAQRPDPTPRREQGRPAVPRAAPSSDVGAAGVALKKGAIRMLHVLAQFHPRRLSRDQLSTLAEVTRGGTFSSYLSSLNIAGYIDTSDRDIGLSAAGAAAAGDAISRSPMTTEQLVAAYSRKLKSGARRMLDLLVDVYPNGYTRNDLSDAAEVTRGGTFSSYLSSLVTNGLAEATRDEVKASATLFLGQA